MLKLYNTLSRSVEEFKSIGEKDKNSGIDPKKVCLYSCGPTVYSTQHLGNMRSAFFTDLLKNTLKYICKYDVTHVVNITDVGHLTWDNDWDADHGEDRMEKWARKDNITARDVAKKYTEEYLKDLAIINIQEFTFVTPATDKVTIKNKMPRATDHIKEQIKMIQELELKGYTYRIIWDGVYMDTSKMQDYGILTNKKNLENIEAWIRIDNSWKRNATDFALRKFNITGKKRDMERESPRGIGFPGRHIECSAMSRQYLWNHFDIHTGGVEHIAIHHTNEIAQSECCWAHKPWVNYRVHNQWLMMNNKKIAKSDGNVAFIKDVIEKWYTWEDLRYFFFQANYRSFQDFTREALDSAKRSRESLIEKTYKFIQEEMWGVYNCEYIVDSLEETKKNCGENFKWIKELSESLLNDLNTNNMLTAIFAALSKKDICLYGFLWLDEKVLKLWISDKVVELCNTIIIIPEDIKKLANDRKQAKINKDRIKADTLKEQILLRWRSIKDNKDGEYTIEPYHYNGWIIINDWEKYPFS